MRPLMNHPVRWSGALVLMASQWCACGQTTRAQSPAAAAGNATQYAPRIAPESQVQGKPAAAEQKTADDHKLPAERGDVIDRLVAIVNGDIVLESDIEEEERFSALYPYRTPGGDTPREQALTRLIDRALILQQTRAPQPEVSDAAIDKDETDLRNDLPACGPAHCNTDAGWRQYLTASGFTEDELRSRLRLREEVLHFIEQRFRSGVRISDEQINNYYTKTMLPQYAKAHTEPPPLSVLSTRIEEVLLQQQVSVLLDQWLKSLRESGNVRILKPGETP